MRPRDEQKEATIREKAIEMIVQEGFDGFSMQKLAKAAGLSASTIYIYFKNREDLLRQLYLAVDEVFAREALRHFDPAMPFEDGLWLQWKNRYRYILKHPLYFHFSEQFRNSPLIRQQDLHTPAFRSAMQQFVRNAVQRKEVAELPAEVFWAAAYGPFYILVQFHLQQSGMGGKPFSLSEQKLKQAFQLVIKALRP
ncbi:TetR/AcrR family transcriptional regulator [Chitinophaga japonensis]|uniref:TetR family transcriptional regulator n=1 Tax=Chitinophaga japonensis TaxID=104662 RepID=A0A562SZD2_CHIJA|nr:TetR/AcrR family transcriptional regulator [Chitinophaga japonensis]TWI86631.1 TetR family transcriptional regulator [Chitinophaga japonensis]